MFFSGGLFHLVFTDRQIGPNEQERCRWLWGRIQDFYQRAAVVDRLRDLTVTKFNPKNGGIEMTGSAAQIMALAPYGVELDSWEHLSMERATSKTCTHHLSTCFSLVASFLERGAGGVNLPDSLARGLCKPSHMERQHLQPYHGDMDMKKS